jgi:hypothetical protein
MNTPIPADGGLRWTAVAAGAGLLLVGALTVMNRVELARLPETNSTDAQDARLQALAARVTDLAEAEARRKTPEAVPLARYETERGAVERRLAAVEQRLDERPASEGLDPLRERLARLEKRLAQLTKKPAVKTPSRPASPPQPKTAEPSFQVIGIERRADERFLSILPRGADGLSQVRLLRVGDGEDGWRLDAIGEDAATFVQGGEKRRLNLPGGKKR